MTASSSRPSLEQGPVAVASASPGEAGPSSAPAGLGQATTMGPEPHDPVDSIVETSGESKLLGRYVVQGTLGRGAMGTVLQGFDPKLDRRVAIKVLHRGRTQRQTQRLMREAQALARLSHPNVVQVYEVGERQGMPFVVMELVRGRTLAQWLEARPRPGWRRCVEVFILAGEGLAAAHEHGLVHRDFKPSNVIVDDRGRVRVLDFGLARQVEGGGPPTTGSVDGGHVEPNALGTPLTRTGGVVGTPAYMPPEQLFGRRVDARSDQFSFCVSLYEAVYAEQPFEGDLMSERIAAVLRGRIRPAPKGRVVPHVLRKILLRGLARTPDQRWPSMASLLAELRRLLRPRSRRWTWMSAGLGLVVVGAGQIYRAEVGQRCAGALPQLRGIWDDPRQREIEAAILGTEQPHAEGTWARVKPRIDDYCAAWVEQYTEACEATAARREQSEEVMELRMSCLRRRRTALEATVSVLAEAEAMDQAVELVVALPRVADCAQIDRLVERRRRVPLPEDPQQARAAAELRDRLEVVRAERKAARYDRAWAQLSSLVEEAEALGYGPLRAEVELEHGILEQSRGRYADAEQRLGGAYALALGSGHDEITVQAATALAHVVGHLQSRPTEGLLWIRTALPLAERSGDETHLSRALLVEGSVLETQGSLASAEARYRRALKIQEARGDGDDLAVATSVSHLGHVLLQQGKLEQAAATLSRALEIQQQVYDGDHPNTALILDNLGTVLSHQGKYEEAEARYRRALQMKRRQWDGDHPAVALGMHNLGISLLKQGDPERAQPVLVDALTMRERVLGKDHPDVVSSLITLTRASYARGDVDATQEYATRALGQASPPLPPDTQAELRFILARVLWADRTQRARARSLVEQAHAAGSRGGLDEEALAPLESWLADHPAP